MLVGAARVASAQSAGAQAESLFRQGKDLVAAGKLAEACAAFDASEKAEPAVTTRLNQADCREKNGQIATAWGLFIDAERETRIATDDRDKALHATAVARAAKLEPLLSTLAITVEHPIDGLEIRRDGARVEAGAWGKALPIDGGTVTITASAPGRREWHGTVTVKPEQDRQAIAIPALAAAPSVERGGVASRSYVVPIALAAGFVALGGVAVGFDLWGDSTYDKSKAATTVSDARDLWHSANTKRYVAETAGIAGVACAGVAIWQFLSVRRERGESSVAVTPFASSDRAGLVLQGRF
ncbi:MAG TPA: hypothetical protein VGM88_32480 [Kofleriaceae bacterium]